MQALTAYWCGRPREAVELADAGLRLAPDGTARARLHSISARARSHVGAEDDTRAALALAAKMVGACLPGVSDRVDGFCTALVPPWGACSLLESCCVMRAARRVRAA